MKITIAALADFSSISSGKLNILGIFDRINAPGFPFKQTSMHLCAKAQISAMDVGDHELVVSVVDPDGKILNSWKWPVVIGNDSKQAININLDLRDVVFFREGPHVVRIQIAGITEDIALGIDKVQIKQP